MKGNALEVIDSEVVEVGILACSRMSTNFKMVGSNGTLGYKSTTSNEAKIESAGGGSASESCESRSELKSNARLNQVSKCFGERAKDTTGLIGMPCLYTMGRPCRYWIRGLEIRRERLRRDSFRQLMSVSYSFTILSLDS